MSALNIIARRALATSQKTSHKPGDIGQIFMQENVQKILRDITRFEDKKIFGRRQVPKLGSPKLMFMSEEQLKLSKEAAYEQARARLQMPPVMAANTTPPAVLDRDYDMIGYTKFRVMFIDITPGISDRARLMSVRESDGTLREPNHEERSRLNHMFYPSDSRSIDTPKMFTNEKNFQDLMKRKEYEFVLNRACVQFEPDDPRYVDITSKVYTHIDDKSDYNMLRSTRHFGPMCLFLAYNKRIDGLKREMLSKKLNEDVAKLDEIFEICHGYKPEQL